MGGVWHTDVLRGCPPQPLTDSHSCPDSPTFGKPDDSYDDPPRPPLGHGRAADGSSHPAIEEALDSPLWK